MTTQESSNLQTLCMIVPSYNEQEAIPYFYEEACRVAQELSEDVTSTFLFVDDGSSDNTLQVVKDLAEKDDRVRYISFSRNFGKEAAIYAGLSHADADFAAIMDADLQDPPSLLPRMMQMIKSGDCDCVGTRRVTRKGEPPIRSWFARRFYKLMDKLSETEIVDGARDFQLMTRPVVDAIVSMGEYNRFSKGIYGWVGFKREWIEYENVERVAGTTKWNFFSLFGYALEGIISFSVKPLIWASVTGVVFSTLSILAFVFIFVRALMFGDPVAGWPSMVCLMLFLAGIQLLSLGILGQYLARTYLEVKKRPIYLVRQTNCIKEASRN